MNMLLSYINWNPDIEAFNLFGFSVRYYALGWIFGFAASYYMVRRQYRDLRISDEKFDPLFVYCFLGMIIGSRLGHCLFYDAQLYFSNWKHFLEIFIPIHFLPDGGWKFTGYTGMASHGGTLGLIIALALYCRKTKMHFVDVLDIIAVATPICCFFIRMGNLMNSEIIGKPTDVPWAFIFEQVDMVPRHPAQLYEALAYFAFFLGMVYLYRRARKQRQTLTIGMKQQQVAALPASWPHRRGFYFGLCLVEIFVFRFFVEFLKENQVDFEQGMALNMGQWLSVPFVAVGLYFMFFYGKHPAKV